MSNLTYLDKFVTQNHLPVWKWGRWFRGMRFDNFDTDMWDLGLTDISACETDISSERDNYAHVTPLPNLIMDVLTNICLVLLKY